jgi:hypothetical protein
LDAQPLDAGLKRARRAIRGSVAVGSDWRRQRSGHFGAMSLMSGELINVALESIGFRILSSRIARRRRAIL